MNILSFAYNQKKVYHLSVNIKEPLSSDTEG